MKKSIFIVLCFFSSFCFSIDRNIAKQFEQAVNSGVGVIATFPEEIRERRAGSLQQKIDISDDGILTIAFSFPCSPLAEEGRKGKPQIATSNKKFRIGDFGVVPGKNYEINLHLNTLAFCDHDVSWVIAFHSATELHRAVILLEKLIASSQNKPAEEIFPSEIAKRAGFQYVVFAPRAPSLDEELRLLKAPEQSKNLLCWLTKYSPKDFQDIFHESYNAFPLFFYDLDILDRTFFYTVPISGMNTFCQCNLGKEYKESVFSDDAKGLEKFFEESPYCGIRLESMPSCSSPSSILTAGCEKKMKQKAQSRGIDIEDIIQKNPDYFDLGTPRGTNFCWFTGLNENSDDIFRYVFWNRKISEEILSKTLYREFPELSMLLRTKSRYRKDLTLAECLTMKIGALSSLEKGLSEFAQRVLLVACFTNELGSPFGNEDELFYNTWPLALTVAEKVNLHEKEKEALRMLLQDQPLPGSKIHSKKGSSLSFLFHEAKQANDLNISLREWATLKMCFYLVLSNQFRAAPEYISVQIKKIKEETEKYAFLLPFGIPFGTQIEKKELPTRSLFSTYIWEVRDPKHRDGLALKKRRDKFERMMIEKPKSPWKGRFLEWVDKECEREKIYPEKYLGSEEERQKYLAVFEKGLLVSPETPPEGDVEFLFVVDAKGRIFLAPKKGAMGPDDPGFSHASFFSGAPVASAGKMIVCAGKIVGLTDHSGHYRSSLIEMKIVLEAIEKAGVSIDAIHVDTSFGVCGQKQEWSSGKEFLSDYIPIH